MNFTPGEIVFRLPYGRIKVIEHYYDTIYIVKLLELGTYLYMDLNAENSRKAVVI